MELGAIKVSLDFGSKPLHFFLWQQRDWGLFSFASFFLRLWSLPVSHEWVLWIRTNASIHFHSFAWEYLGTRNETFPFQVIRLILKGCLLSSLQEKKNHEERQISGENSFFHSMWPAQLQQSQDDDDGSDKCFPTFFLRLPHPYHHYTSFSIGWGSMLTFKDTDLLIPSIIGCHHDFTLIHTQFGRKRHCPVRRNWRTVLIWSILTWGMFDTCSQPRQMMLMICASKFFSLLYSISPHQDHQELHWPFLSSWKHRVWSRFVDCVRRYVSSCFNDERRTKFNMGKSTLDGNSPRWWSPPLSFEPFYLYIFPLLWKSTTAVENSVDTVHAICSSDSVQRGKCAIVNTSRECVQGKVEGRLGCKRMTLWWLVT